MNVVYGDLNEFPNRNQIFRFENKKVITIIGHYQTITKVDYILQNVFLFVYLLACLFFL